MEESFRSLGLPFIPSQSNFILVKVPVPAQELYESLLRRGVIIRSMKSFGLDRYIRFNIGLPVENRRLFTALREILAG